MPDDLLLVVIISGVAAVASVVGGLLALWHRSSTLISSLAFGVASGALIGTVTLEMLPTALESGALAVVVIGFAAGHARPVPLRPGRPRRLDRGRTRRSAAHRPALPPASRIGVAGPRAGGRDERRGARRGPGHRRRRGNRALARVRRGHRHRHRQPGRGHERRELIR